MVVGTARIARKNITRAGLLVLTLASALLSCGCAHSMSTKWAQTSPVIRADLTNFDHMRTVSLGMRGR